MSISNPMLLRFASGVPSYGFRDRQRFALVPKITCCKKMCKQSFQQSDQSCFCTNTSTTHTRQNKPYRLGTAPAGIVGARGRCCPAATVSAAAYSLAASAAVLLKKNKIKSSTEKQSSAIIVHEAKRTGTSTRTHTRQNLSLIHIPSPRD